MIGDVQEKIKITNTFPENEACDQLLCRGQTWANFAAGGAKYAQD